MSEVHEVVQDPMARPMPGESLGLTTVNIIQRLASGERFTDIANQVNLMSVEEIEGLRPDESRDITVANVLARLNAVRVRAGTLHNAVLGSFQKVANEVAILESARVTEWSGLNGFKHLAGYDHLLRTRVELVNYPPTAHEFMCVTGSLRHFGTEAACADLKERDPGWRVRARDVKKCKIAAHAQMRRVLDEIQIGPGPDDTVANAIEIIEQSMRTGVVSAREGKMSILALVREASGFRVPQRVMQLASHKDAEARKWLERPVSYSESGLAGLANRIDNATSMFQVIFGFTTLRRILGEEREEVVPNMLAHDLSTLTSYITGTAPDMPFDPSNGATSDFMTWMNGIAGTAQAGASIEEGTLVLPHVDRIGSGRCPVQHVVIANSPSAVELPEHMQVLQTEVKDRFGVDLGFDQELPSIGKVALANAIETAAKPGGPLHPDSVGLDAMVRHIQERVPKSSMQRLVQLARFLLKPGMHTPVAYTSKYYTEPGLIFEP
ncbi:MAG TPA: hypothetical protein VK694_05000 [Verrucomicrobiae bacterium]|nr:hypothetical protein [Verrucomicrobiae bacterium]